MFSPSVGSLGENPAVADEVEQVFVQNSICDKTLNCARIKTWMVHNTLILSNYEITSRRHMYCI